MSYRSKRTRAVTNQVVTPTETPQQSHAEVSDPVLNVPNDQSRRPNQATLGSQRQRTTTSKGPRVVSGNDGQVPNWSDDIQFDEKEDVLTIDADGNEQIMTGSIHPRDVWFSKEGTRFVVLFNEFNQPIRKGGSLFVRFLREVARREELCPIGVTNWRHLNERYKIDIIDLVRGNFVFSEGKVFNEGVFRHVSKHCRQYRYELKAKNFKPDTMTRQAIENTVPFGHTRDNWLALVEYWYSEKSKRLAQKGREARASQDHFHTNGCTSFANSRADFEDENGREPTSLELLERTYKRKDGSYVADSASQAFIEEAKSKVEQKLADSSPSKRVEIENEVFNELMYDKDKPNQRPLGYGLGVRRSDVLGVHGELRKRKFNCINGSPNMEIAQLKKQNAETHNLLKTVALQMAQVLDAVSNCAATPTVLNAARSALNIINTHVENIPNTSSSDDESGRNDDSERDDPQYAYPI